MCFEGNQAAAAAAAAAPQQQILMMRFKIQILGLATISQPIFGSKLSFALLPPAFFKNISRSSGHRGGLGPPYYTKTYRYSVCSSAKPAPPRHRVCRRVCCSRSGGAAKGEHFTPSGISKAPAQTKCSVRSCRVCFLQLRMVPSA